MLIISLLAAAAAASTPTYLRCTFPTAPTEVLVAADEANGAATVNLPSTGYAERLPAAFLAKTLTVSNGFLRLVIDRTDLKVARSGRGSDAAAGTCEVEDAPKRAF